jgi:WD40 repeat protein/DNA-binding SARP family transcriptional activator
VRFQLLGPLAASGDDGPIAVGGPKQRLVLAHLLLRLNTTVPIDQLIDAVWGEEPPETARATLQTYVSRLRGLLGSGRIEGEAPGYRLNAVPEELDNGRFETLLKEAREDGLDPKAAVDVLDEALELWRGPALADLASEPSLFGEIARLEELRLVAVEERIAARLDLGHHADVVAELEAATAAHPMRERLWGQLILALYRSGRQADALAAFDRARRILVDELGIDPSRELQDLHERVLRQDESLQQPGGALRGYRLLDKVGEGAFGSVFRAIQPQVEREVAIKAIHAELANQPDFVRRFEREAQLVARLEHPHIVPLYDYWREPDAAYLIMRFLRGGSLEDELRDGPLELERAAQILDQVGAGLAAAHHQGVVHRDVKPGNMLLDEEGNAYLSDFGIALEAGAPEQTAGTMIRGTPAYLSPEQIRLEQTSPRSDIYALGVVLYEMLTAEHPFPGTSLQVLLDQHLNHQIPSVREKRPTVGPAVDAAIARATAKDPQARFDDVLEFCAAYRGAVEGSGARVLIPGELRNPYKGLRSFLEADSADFFGRELLTRRLIERLAETGAARFLCVVGPSGSGKSSAVRAGLVPAIRRGVIPGSDRWYVADLLPGPHPMRELERALLGVGVDPPPSLLEDLERDELGLTRAVGRLLPDPDAELLIVLDQLEELFTMVESDAERLHVLESLRVAASDPASRVRVVATLRADFFDQPLSVRGFGDLLAARNEAITPMAPEELERAIVGPAERVGLDVEPGLVAAMVADVIDRPGALPLLQYALTELADREDVTSLTLNGYRRIGGVSGALARRAEHLYDALDDDGRVACRQLFLRLITLGEGTEDTRRRTRRSEVATTDPAPTEAVIDAFGRHRLLSFDRDPATREPTIEIAHEALLRAWTRIRGWVDDARDDLRTRDSIAASASEWDIAGRDDSFLLRGARLDRVDEWSGTTSVALTSTQEQYLAASVQRRDEEAAAETERRTREAALERRSSRRLRALVAVFAAAALIAALLTAVATSQRGRAERGVKVATARELAAAASANLDADPQLTLLLALQAIRTMRTVDGVVLREAEEALHRGIVANRIVMALPGFGGYDVDWSPDGSLLVATARPDAPGIVVLRDASTGEVVRSWEADDRFVGEAEFIPDGSAVVTSGGGLVRLWDPATGSPIRTLPGPGGEVWGVSFSSDGARLAAIWGGQSTGGVARILDVSTGRLIREVPDLHRMSGDEVEFPQDTALSPDGSLLAVGVWGDRPAVEIYDVRTGRLVRSMPSACDFELAWNTDRSLLAGASCDGLVRVWDPSTGTREFTLFLEGSAERVDWSLDGSRLATLETGGKASVWEIGPEGGRVLLELAIPGVVQRRESGIAFNPDGDRILTTDASGNAAVWDVGMSGDAEWMNIPTRHDWFGDVTYAPNGRWLAGNLGMRVGLWDAQTAELVRTIRGHDPVPGFEGIGPAAIAASPDGRLLATAGRDRKLRVWRVDSGEEVLSFQGHTGGLEDVAFSPDGRLLATASWDFTARVVDVATGQEVHAFPHGEAVFSVRFTPDGDSLVTGSLDESVRVWDLADGSQTLQIDSGSSVRSVDIDPSGTLVAVGTSGGTASVWDLGSGERVATLAGHSGEVWAVAFSPDGTIVATGSDDRTIRLWNPRSGESLLVLGGHTGPVRNLAYSPDGSRLASISQSDTIRVWALDLDDLIRLAEKELTRSFTDEECRQYLHLSACRRSGSVAT